MYTKPQDIEFTLKCLNKIVDGESGEAVYDMLENMKEIESYEFKDFRDHRAVDTDDLHQDTFLTLLDQCEKRQFRPVALLINDKPFKNTNINESVKNELYILESSLNTSHWDSEESLREFFRNNIKHYDDFQVTLHIFPVYYFVKRTLLQSKKDGYAFNRNQKTNTMERAKKLAAGGYNPKNPSTRIALTEVSNIEYLSINNIDPYNEDDAIANSLTDHRSTEDIVMDRIKMSEIKARGITNDMLSKKCDRRNIPKLALLCGILADINVCDYSISSLPEEYIGEIERILCLKKKKES